MIIAVVSNIIIVQLRQYLLIIFANNAIKHVTLVKEQLLIVYYALLDICLEIQVLDNVF